MKHTLLTARMNQGKKCGIKSSKKTGNANIQRRTGRSKIYDSLTYTGSKGSKRVPWLLLKGSVSYKLKNLYGSRNWLTSIPGKWSVRKSQKMYCPCGSFSETWGLPDDRCLSRRSSSSNPIIRRSGLLPLSDTSSISSSKTPIILIGLPCCINEKKVHSNDIIRHCIINYSMLYSWLVCRVHAPHLTWSIAASFSVKLEWESENGMISLEPLFADCGTMSFKVSGLTLVKSWSSCPNSFTVQLGSASTSSWLPLQVTDIRAILFSSILFLIKNILTLSVQSMWPNNMLIC